jgi:CRP/FNR family transcriptional regulator, cyclic AMP receptor protein
MPLTAPQHAVMRRSTWFQQLPAELADFLLRRAVPKRLNPGQHLFFRGDAPDGLYALVEGTLSVSGVSEDGREAMLSILEPSAWFGEIALFDHLPRTHHVGVISRQPALVLHVPQVEIESLLSRQPAYWRDFGVLLAQKTRLFMINMEDSALMTPERRLARRLVWSTHMIDPLMEMPVCRLPFSQANLASMLALSRQTVNQLLGGLQDAGLIRVSYGVIEVIDRLGLVMVGQVSVREAEILGARLPTDPAEP